MNHNLPFNDCCASLLWLTLAAMPLWSHGHRRAPTTKSSGKLTTWQLRQYAPYVVAEVVLNASADEAGNQRPSIRPVHLRQEQGREGSLR